MLIAVTFLHRPYVPFPDPVRTVLGPEHLYFTITLYFILGKVPWTK